MALTSTVKPAVPIIIAISTSSQSNSNAVVNGFRVTNVTARSPTIKQKFGGRKKGMSPQYFAARADAKYRSLNILAVIRPVRRARAASTPGVPITITFILDNNVDGRAPLWS
jgi:hypothetical protein